MTQGFTGANDNTGDVVGPGSSTDNALARFDGTTGKLLQNSTVIVTDAGEMTNASQPAFLANCTAQNNITGDGTTYTVTFATQIFNQGSDFDGTSTFTSPVTGRYNLISGMQLNQLTTGMTIGQLSMVTSNNTFQTGYNNPGAVMDINNTLAYLITVLADMDAADTATVSIRLTNGTKVVDIASSIRNTFAGYLVT